MAWLCLNPLPCAEQTLLQIFWQRGSHKSHVPFITSLPRSRLFRESVVAGSHLGPPKCYNKAIPTPNFPSHDRLSLSHYISPRRNEGNLSSTISQGTELCYGSFKALAKKAHVKIIAYPGRTAPVKILQFCASYFAVGSGTRIASGVLRLQSEHPLPC